MMSDTPIVELERATETLFARLDAVRARRRRLEAGRRVLRAAWMAAAGVTALLLADAAWRWGPWTRVGWGVAWGLAAATGCVWAMWRREGTTQAMHGEARRLERDLWWEGNPLINAVCLSRDGGTASEGMAGALTRRAVALGEAKARTVDPCIVVDARSWRREAWLLTLVMAMGGMLLVLAPGLVTTGLSRWMRPWGGRAPYGRTHVTVSVTPADLVRGQDATVTASLSGRSATTVELVELDGDEREIRRWPMPGGWPRHEFTLASLRESMRVRVETPTGWSDVVRIEPRDVATPEAAATATADETAGPAGQGPARASADAAGKARAVLHDLKLLESRAGRLSESAEALRERLLRIGGAGSPPAWLEAEWRRIETEAEQYDADVAALAQRLRELARWCRSQNLSAGLCEALEAAAAAMEKAGTGRGRGAAGGAGQAMEGLRVVAAAARRDAPEHAKSATRLASAMGGSSSGGGRGGIERIAPGELARGQAVETQAAGGTAVDRWRAMAEQAPVSYREWVARYFEAISRDERTWADPSVPPATVP